MKVQWQVTVRPPANTSITGRTNERALLVI